MRSARIAVVWAMVALTSGPALCGGQVRSRAPVQPAGANPDSGPSFSASDFARLHWLVGRWRGTGAGALGGMPPFFEEYRVVDDSTLVFRSFAGDSLATHVAEEGFLRFRAGRIGYRSLDGRSTYRVIRVAADTVVYDANGGTTLVRESDDRWRVEFGASGDAQARSFHMQRRRDAPQALPPTPADRTRDLLDRLAVGPGIAVVGVTLEGTDLEYAAGFRRAATRDPVTLHTPMYVASQTKAFVGLLAAALDARGVLSLDTRLNDVWPELVLPGELKPSDYDLRDLLTHQLPIEAAEINSIEIYVSSVDPADYPDLIRREATLREPGFSYDNLGYNIYAAILEARTGRDWRSWLDEVLIQPMGWTGTSARMSDFTAEEVAWNHTWTGPGSGWVETGNKTDAQMQSAGGILVSPADMVSWLRLYLRGTGPEGSGLTRRILAEARAPAVEFPADAPSPYGLPCDGYSLGWMSCDLDGHALLIHGGTFNGSASVMAFSPSLGLGVAVFTNSDNATAGLVNRVAEFYLRAHMGDDELQQRADHLVEQHDERQRVLLERRIATLEERDRSEMWEGWSWSPTLEDLLEYAGLYASDDSYVPLRVFPSATGLYMANGDMVWTLRPVKPDVFGGKSLYWMPYFPFHFVRSEGGAVEGLRMFGEVFLRRR